MKIVSAHQPHYLPWIGYFNRIHLSDVFVIADNMEFTKYNYLSRNRIVGTSGIIMLIVPVSYKGSSRNPINEIELDSKLSEVKLRKHLRSVEHNYRKMPGFPSFFPLLEKQLLAGHTSLCELNTTLIREICRYLQIDTEIVLASEKNISGIKEHELFLSMLESTNSDTLLLGMGASNQYIDKEEVIKHGFKVLQQKFSHPEYAQNSSAFQPGVSVIDLLMCVEQPQAIEMVKNCGDYNE